MLFLSLPSAICWRWSSLFRSLSGRLRWEKLFHCSVPHDTRETVMMKRAKQAEHEKLYKLKLPMRSLKVFDSTRPYVLEVIFIVLAFIVSFVLLLLLFVTFSLSSLFFSLVAGLLWFKNYMKNLNCLHGLWLHMEIYWNYEEKHRIVKDSISRVSNPFAERVKKHSYSHRSYHVGQEKEENGLWIRDSNIPCGLRNKWYMKSPKSIMCMEKYIFLLFSHFSHTFYPFWVSKPADVCGNTFGKYFFPLCLLYIYIRFVCEVYNKRLD